MISNKAEDEAMAEWKLAHEPPTFEEWPSIARLSRDCVVSEKLDGSNASIHVTTDGRVYAGSRTRWITPEDDNFGFARWVKEHEIGLAAELGPGTHFGEWWGQGIQRNYGLKEKRFSLFNTTRWKDEVLTFCHVVPVLYEGLFDTTKIDEVLEDLRVNGSYATFPRYPKPEGVVIYHIKANQMFKKTLDSNDLHKGSVKPLDPRA
jgi:hypothetical protein